MRVRTLCVALAFLVNAGVCICAAQEFSADVAYVLNSKPDAAPGATATPGHNPWRLYVSKDKMRLDTRGQAGAVLIVNAAEESAFALFPAKKEYEPLDGSLSEYFRVADAENACPEWQKTAAQKVNCEKVGHEIVNGRQTVKYRNRGALDSAISAVWIDLGVKFVVKWETAGTAVELCNIQEGQQPADLFTVPADYEVPKPRKGNNRGFSSR